MWKTLWVYRTANSTCWRSMHVSECWRSIPAPYGPRNCSSILKKLNQVPPGKLLAEKPSDDWHYSRRRSRAAHSAVGLLQGATAGRLTDVGRCRAAQGCLRISGGKNDCRRG